MTVLLVILAVVFIGGGIVGGMYNGLVKARNKRKSAWSDIQTHLKKRYDLIPNLVETVKGITKHESETFENVVKARNAAMGAQTVGDQSKTENALSGTLKSLFALSESYPDLKANSNFLKLQEDLNGIENDLNMSRRYFNGATQELNNKVEQFPTNILAGMFGFVSEEFFELDNEDEAKNVKVSF
ncbi:hypothetical protein CSB37_00495 [bacterium DOLZORAL124_38_8]|nr:MAG: hypothetical protein CSB37_00495 [bacterium DOLZORAL124_38_8]